MKKPLLIAAAACSAAMFAPAAYAANEKGAAAEQAEAAPAAEEELADISLAALILRVFTEAFESSQVSQPVKGQLLACLYNNKLSTISGATRRVLAENPEIRAEDMTVLYRVAAGICGVTFARPQNGSPENGQGDAPASSSASDDFQSR